ncbi:ribosomal biogenesis regulatory protein [Nemania sp. NC0429]|nr:ribosomal biogenesis regulatory protein [Nemania sp. NC0429]
MSLAAAGKGKAKLEVVVERPTPYTFDLGFLLANDANPITTSTPAEPSSLGVDALETQLIATARDGAQALINQLLTTCPITSTPQGVLLSLPAPSTALPREKPLPEAKPPTKWQQFAAKRGIKPKTREQRRMRSQKFNEETGEWEKTWGFNKDGRVDRKQKGMVQQDWLVELDGDDDKKKKATTNSEGRELRRNSSSRPPNRGPKGKKR